MHPDADAEVASRGKMVGITPLSFAARRWVMENVRAEARQDDNSLSITTNARGAMNLISGMRYAGLNVVNREG